MDFPSCIEEEKPRRDRITLGADGGGRRKSNLDREEVVRVLQQQCIRAAEGDNHKRGGYHGQPAAGDQDVSLASAPKHADVVS